MFYVAYFKKDVPPESRPITFIYNGGPGSSSMWLHMGAFGPKRIVTADDQHTSPAPYELADNAYSLLDASDLVFIDAPGTGYGRLFGKDKEKAFWGVDPDAHAFARFIKRFLSNYQRWNSPKYLFGESYGTTRSAALAGILETERHRPERSHSALANPELRRQRRWAAMEPGHRCALSAGPAHLRCHRVLP